MLMSAFFSSLETGLLAIGDAKIKQWVNTNYVPLKDWIENPAGVITGILIGNNLVNIAFSAVFTVLVVAFMRERHDSKFVTEVVSIIFSSVIILSAGEILPKTYANTHPDRIVKLFYKPFITFFSFLKPVVNVLNRVSFSVLGIMEMEKDKIISRREVDIMLHELSGGGVLKQDSSSMLKKVLFMAKRTVGEVMTQREAIYSIDLERDYSSVINSISAAPFSRIPAYSKKLNNIKGVIYIKDVIGSFRDSAEFDPGSILRDPIITYPGRNCQHLFHEMRRKSIHCAIVKCKKRVVGFVTIEDLIEEIVGDIL